MRAVVALALVLAACGGGLTTVSPTPVPSPLPAAELKYRVMDVGGRIEFCDPDFYPIARAGGEEENAKAKLPTIQGDAETYAAITKRVGTDALAVYRDWKALNALQLTASGSVFAFDYRSGAGPNSTPTKVSGMRIQGTVSAAGKVNVTDRTPAGPLNCPICLARDTKIATPSGDVAVQDLHVGDMVWTLVDGARVAAPLVAIGSTPVPPTHEVARLMLSDGRSVLVSPGHPTADGRRVGDLRAGDELDGAIPERFFALQDELRAHARRLVAASGRHDRDAIADAFAGVARGCVSCHQAFVHGDGTRVGQNAPRP
jgi:hypothetical protein